MKISKWNVYFAVTVEHANLNKTDNVEYLQSYTNDRRIIFTQLPIQAHWKDECAWNKILDKSDFAKFIS